MGNSKDRRKLRRLIQQLGLSAPQKTPVAPQKPASIPFWKRIPAWVYAAAALVSIGITLAEGYPWLSVQENAYLDPADAFSQMFSISNQGYVPITDIDVTCFPRFRTTRNNGVEELDVKFSDFSDVAHYLGHGGTVTIPCFKIPDVFQNMGNKLPSATLEVTVNYALYHMNLKQLRRSQHFHFESVVGKDHSQHWKFLQ